LPASFVDRNMNEYPIRRRVIGTAISAAVVTAGLIAAASPAEGVATAPCDPAGVSASDNALAARLAGQLQGSLRTTITGYRVSCARVVVTTVRASGMDRGAAVAAITSTIVESGLQNIAQAVDHDSLGLFQQRATWGSAANRLNAVWATNAFLGKLGRVYPNGSYATVAVGTVVQRVQVSAYPSRYQAQAADAALIVAALWVDPANTSLVAGDVTGDGRADLIGRRSDGSLWVVPNTGHRTALYPTGKNVGSGWQQYLWLQAADIDGDGHADLLAARPDGTLWLSHATGTGVSFGAGTQVGIGWHAFIAVALADVSGDGHPDMLAVLPDGTMWRYAGTGSLAAPFQPGQQIGIGWQAYDQVVAGDVNGNGHADIVAVRPDGTLWLYPSTGNPAAPFQPGVQIGTGWQQYNRLVLARVTADRFADLLGTRPDGTLVLYPNQHTAGPPFAAGVTVGSGWQQYL
jgi:FG-GAP-like repeat